MTDSPADRMRRLAPLPLSSVAYKAEIERREKAKMLKEVERDAAAIRVRCRTFSEFVKQAWRVIEPGTKLKWNWHMQAMCDHLQAIVEGRLRGRIIINVPPGSSKSTIVSVMLQAWEWGPMGNRHKRYVSTSFDLTNVKRDTSKTLDIIRSDWFQSLWPEVDLKTEGVQSFSNFDTGTRLGVAFKSVTGKRGDCLLGETIVETDRGPKTIRDIANSTVACNVLSHVNHTGKLVYRPVQAVARRQAAHFYRVHFASGVVVEATGDHRFYTPRGYREARLLSPGDDCLRLVSNPAEARCIPDEESGSHGHAGGLLQSPMSDEPRQCKSGQDGHQVHGMREPGTQGFATMQPGMSGCVDQTTLARIRLASAGTAMPDLQHHLPAALDEKRREVLLQGVCQSGTCRDDGRGEQSGLARRDECDQIHPLQHPAVPASATEDHSEGWWGMRRLPVDQEAVRSSHRYESGPQCLGELGDHVPVLSHPAACGGTLETVEDTVAVVERVCEPAVVYDIQVADTHCFFANGILVHNCLIVDDPHSVDGAESETQRENTTRKFIEGGLNRINDWETSVIIIVMQRLHEQDLTGVLLSRKYGFIHLMIPMEFEPARRCTTPLKVKQPDGTFKDWTDPRTYDGELMDPVREPPEAILEKKESGEYMYAGQYQQRPAPREGGLFKADLIGTVESCPPGGITVAGWDLAGSKGKKSAYTVRVLMTRVGGDIYIRHVERRRANPTEVEEMIAEVSADDRNQIPGVLISIPQDPGFGGKAFKWRVSEILIGFNYVSTPEVGDKEGRARPFAAQVGAERVFMVRGEWNSVYREELRTFPSGTYKDQVDASSRAFAELVGTPDIPENAAPELMEVDADYSLESDIDPWA